MIYLTPLDWRMLRALRCWTGRVWRQLGRGQEKAGSRAAPYAASLKSSTLSQVLSNSGKEAGEAIAGSEEWEEVKRGNGRELLDVFAPPASQLTSFSQLCPPWFPPFNQALIPDKSESWAGPFYFERGKSPATPASLPPLQQQLPSSQRHRQLQQPRRSTCEGQSSRLSLPAIPVELLYFQGKVTSKSRAACSEECRSSRGPLRREVSAVQEAEGRN